MNEKIKRKCESVLEKAKKEPYKYGFWCIAALFLIPGLIWILYFFGDNIGILINTSLTVGDALGFYATLLSFIGTVVLAGAALWQNHSFRLESRRKEEYAIRPYLFSEIEDRHIDFLEEQKVEYLMIEIENDNQILICGANRNMPKDVAEYSKYKQQHRLFDYTVRTQAEKLTKTFQFGDILKKEEGTLTALNKKYQLISYRLENHGAGSAVKVNLTINGQHTIPLFCLSSSEVKQIYLLVDAEKLQQGQTTRFDLTITFYNIEDCGPYVQRELFSIKRTETDDLNLFFDKQISSPVLVKKEATTDDKT